MRCLAILLLTCFCTAAQVPEAPPEQLLDAAHCLAATNQDWIRGAHHNAAELELGYVDDAKSYPGQELVYLVDYTTPTHSAGQVSTFLERGKAAHRVVRVQLTIAFRQSDDGSQRIELVDPPLGGIGTQDEVVAAIRKVGFHTYTVQVGDLVNRATQCESESAVK
jgi:hypothetical protein